MLDLVRLSPRLLFPPGGRDLYRHIALLADLSPGDEILVSGCGNGVTLEYFVREWEVQGSGVDVDAPMVNAATARARERGLNDRMQFQQAPLDDLPYRDAIFDVAVGELGLTAAADPADAVAELVRTVRPGGTVVLVQLAWTAPVDEERRRVLGEHLGLQPLMLVEWKRILREAGLRNLHTEDWTDEETAFRRSVAKPFPDFAELFSIPEKIGILRRAWSRWGWTGVRTVLVREREVHRLLTQERILGLDLVKGVRPVPDDESDGGAASDAGPPPLPADPSAAAGEAPPEASGPADADTPPPSGPVDGDDDHRDTRGLPLFGDEAPPSSSPDSGG
jgi:ubiquinone/menaquinone biosynthesis C-methylase UbiE